MLGVGVGDVLTAHAHVLAATDSLIVVDAHQTIVGPVFGGIDGAARASVVFHVEPWVVTLIARKNSFEGVLKSLYESTDCTGNPVMDADGSSGIPLHTQIFSPVTIGAMIPGQNSLGKV